MSAIDNYPPAFPTGEEHGFNSGVPGMTLRDYFAAKAMQVALAQCTSFPDENWRVGVAMDAYAMADAMIQVRQS